MILILQTDKSPHPSRPSLFGPVGEEKMAIAGGAEMGVNDMGFLNTAFLQALLYAFPQIPVIAMGIFAQYGLVKGKDRFNSKSQLRLNLKTAGADARTEKNLDVSWQTTQL